VIYTSGPVITAFDVYSDFFSYHGGVYSYVSGEKQGGHAVLIVGWNDLDSAFIVKNSWGTGWGESGSDCLQELTGRQIWSLLVCIWKCADAPEPMRFPTPNLMTWVTTYQIDHPIGMA
jgi:hypothetical protein